MSHSFCPNRPQTYPEPETVADGCGSCEQLCCQSAQECSSWCSEEQAVQLVMSVALLFWVAPRIPYFREEGKGWSHPQLVLHFLAVAFALSRIIYEGGHLLFGAHWTDPSRKVPLMILYWTPLASICAGTASLLFLWSRVLSKFEMSPRGIFSLSERFIRGAASVVIICLYVSAFLLDHVSPPVFIGITNGGAALYIVYQAVVSLATAREIRNTLSSVTSHGENSSKDSQVIERMTKLGTNMGILSVLGIVLMVVISPVVSSGASDEFPSALCEAGFFAFRTLEWAAMFLLAWVMRGSKVGSATSTPDTGTPVERIDPPFAPTNVRGDVVQG